MVVACFEFFFGQLCVSEKEMGMAHFGILAQSRALDSLVFLVSIFGLDPQQVIMGKFVSQRWPPRCCRLWQTWVVFLLRVSFSGWFQLGKQQGSQCFFGVAFLLHTHFGCKTSQKGSFKPIGFLPQVSARALRRLADRIPGAP